MVGAMLALAGEDVTFLVRGANLAAIRSQGIKLIAHDGSGKGGHQRARHRQLRRSRPAGPGDPGPEGASGGGRAPASCRKLFGPDTVRGHHAERYPVLVLPSARRRAGRPPGAQRRSGRPTWPPCIPPDRVIGCVVYPACPSWWRPAWGAMSRATVSLWASWTARPARACRPFRTASRGPASRRPCWTISVREIWLKLWGNLSFNPISALSHTTLVGHLPVPAAARELAARHDARGGNRGRASWASRSASHSISASPAWKRSRRHKTSMLMDVEAGRGPEIDALVGIGGRTGRASPARRRRTSTRSMRWSSCWTRTMSEESGHIRLQKMSAGLAGTVAA